MKARTIFAAFAAVLTVGCTNPTKDRKEANTEPFPQGFDTTCEPTLTHEDTLTAMFNAFCRQESNCDVLAVSPCGRYVGCLQVSEIMVREANRIIGDSTYSYNDRYDPDCSFGIFMAVQRRHNKNLNIDRAIDIWNPRCPDSYRQNVKNFYTDNLLKINKH